MHPLMFCVNCVHTCPSVLYRPIYSTFFRFFFGIGHWTTDMCFCSPAVEGITQVYSFRGAGGVFLISSFHVVVLHSIRQVVGMYVIVWLPQLGNY